MPRGAGAWSVPEVLVGERQVGHLFFEKRNRRLKIIALGARDPHRVALNACLYFELTVFDEPHDFLGVIAGHTVPHGNQLFDLVTANLLNVADVEKSHIDTAFGELAKQNVAHLTELEIIVSECGAIDSLP